MKPTPPPRLLDDPEAGSQLRDDLRQATDAPVRYDAVAGLASLRAAIGAPVPPLGTGAESAAGGSAAGTAGTGVAASAGAGKLVLASVGAAVLLAGAVAVVALPRVSSPEHEPRPAAARGTSTAPRSAAVVTSTPTAVPAAAPVAVSPAPAPATEGSAQHALPPDPDGKLRREIAQLARIKELLPGHPADAYRLAQSGNREFSRGVLAQEREGLAVLALAALGRAREAEQRATAFLVSYPSSPLRDRIAAIAAGRRAP